MRNLFTYGRKAQLVYQDFFNFSSKHLDKIVERENLSPLPDDILLDEAQQIVARQLSELPKRDRLQITLEDILDFPRHHIERVIEREKIPLVASNYPKDKKGTERLREDLCDVIECVQKGLSF